MIEKAKPTLVARIAQTKQKYFKRKKSSHDKHLRLMTGKSLIMSFVLNVAFYGAEAWNIHKDDERKIEAFEIECRRRTMKIARTDKVRNEDSIPKNE